MQRSFRDDTREVRLPAGTIRYQDRGRGAPIVFVHGLLVNGGLWRKVVPRLDAGYRCLVPDWPLGSHARAMESGADLTPYGVARTIADFLDALDLEDVTLVGNDTGGALCQVVATRHPERIGRLVLTPSDAFDNFPPRLFHYLLWAARVPGALAALLQGMRFSFMRRSPLAYGWLAKRPIDPAALESWVAPALDDPLVRRDLAKVLRGLDPAVTRATAAALPGSRSPCSSPGRPRFASFPSPTRSGWRRSSPTPASKRSATRGPSSRRTSRRCSRG